MPTETDKARMRLFLGLKEKPELASFRFLQDLKKHIAEELKAFKAQIKEEIRNEIQTGITEEMQESIFRGVKKIKGDSGEQGLKGEKGDSIKGDIGKTGLRGERGPEGPLGPQGTKGESIVGPKGELGPKGEKGPKGDPGSPDTPKDIKNKLERLKGEERLDASAIKNLEKLAGQTILVGGDRGRRLWRKDNVVPTGTIDGSNDTFTLPSQMKDDTEHVFVNGFRQKKGSTEDYTVSNSRTQIIFNSDTIPQTNDKIIVDYEEDR